MEKIKVKKTKPMKVAYIEHVGPYDRIPWDEYMSRLFRWAKEHKVRPGFRGIGIYFDNPEQVSPEECRSEVAIQINKGPANQLGEIYRKIGEWMEENGYEWAGPSMEIYSRKPRVVKGEVIISITIQVPIKKK